MIPTVVVKSMARVVLSLVLAVTFLPSSALARPASPDLVREYLEVSGLRRQLELVVPRAMAEFEGSRGTLPSKQYALVLSAFGQAFHADEVFTSILSQVEGQYQERFILDAIRFYRSPVGRKIVQANDEAFSAHLQQLARAYYDRASQDPTTPFRITLLNHIDQATGMSEQAAEVGMLTARAVATALDTILEPDQRLGEEKIRQQMVIMRPQMVQSHHQSTVVEMLYRYRDLTLDELRYYRRFLESESGRHCTDITRSAVTTALLQVSQHVADILSASGTNPSP